MDALSLAHCSPASVTSRRRVTVSIYMAGLAVALMAAGEGPDRPVEAEAEAPSAAHTPGRLIRVQLPVTSTVSRTIQNAALAAVRQFDQENSPSGSRPVLIFELDPGKTKDGQGGRFTDALSLAEFLTGPNLARVKTVAYIQRPIKGHGVLVAMACEEIVMAADAELGDAGIDEPAEAPIKPVVLSGYTQIANDRRTIPAPVALGMLDKSLEVHKVETGVSLEFVLREDIDPERVNVSDEVLIRRGDLGSFTGQEARELGFAKYLAADREQVSKALNLAPDAVQEDPLLGRPLEACQLELSGPIEPQRVGLIQSMIDDELRSGEVNFVCLRIDSSGGSLADSLTLANYLADLNGSTVRTVAYVPSEARDGAALVAMACDQLVMHPNAVMGGDGAVTPEVDQIEASRITIRELATRKSKAWSSIAALIDPSLEIFEYQNRESGAVAYLSLDEVNEQENPDLWDQRHKITKDDTPLEVNGKQAKQYGLARETVESFAEFRELYGLPEELRLVKPSWADFLIDALASPGVAMLLLVIGGAGLYAELQAPGIGVGGFLASVAFLLFFWSKFLYGTSTWLEVMLFLGGICCLLLEIFVIPGFGIFGLGGGLMIIVSLVLASQTFVLPKSGAQLTELRNSMLVVAGAGLGIMGSAAIMRRFLPHAPMFNRLMLNPLEGQEMEDLSQREAVVDFSHLVGGRGTTVTQLTPSGKARFDNELIDVIADSEVIERGCEIEVVDVRGNRILVRAV